MSTVIEPLVSVAVVPPKVSVIDRHVGRPADGVGLGVELGELLADAVASLRAGRHRPVPATSPSPAAGAWLSTGSALASALGVLEAPAAAGAEGNASGGALSPRRTWS